jgi:protoheme IX farnesyltransferase
MRMQITTRGTLALERSRAMDYITLTKPELTFLSVLTALAGYYMGAGGVVEGTGLIHTLLGTAMVGGGSGALNQYIERKYDAQMKRTENRPLPSGRIAPLEALLFGLVLSCGGIVYLALCINTLTASLAAITCVTYLSLYTPLKRLTPLATLIGGIPGALPPVMGWTAASNEIGAGALILFGILFLWQMPHFLSLSWMYRKDYARAGYRLLAVMDPGGSRTGLHAILYTCLLIPVSLLLLGGGGAGMIYGVSAGVLGAGFLLFACLLLARRTSGAARRLFFASLMYLPALMLAMVLDRVLR